MAQKVALICAHAVSTNHIATRASRLKRECVELSWENAWPLGHIHSGLPIEKSTRHESLLDQPLDSLIAARWRTLFIRRHLGSGDELGAKHCCRGQ